MLSAGERVIRRHRQCPEHVPFCLLPFCNRAAQAVGRKHPPALSHEQSELICVISGLQAPEKAQWAGGGSRYRPLLSAFLCRIAPSAV